MDKLSFMFHFTETESFSVKAFHLLSKLNSFSLHFSFLISFSFCFVSFFNFFFFCDLLLYFFPCLLLIYWCLLSFFPFFLNSSFHFFFLSSALFITALLHFHNVFIYCWRNNLTPCLPFFFYVLSLIFLYTLHFFMLSFYPLSSVNTFLHPAIFDFILLFSFQYNNLYNGQLKRIHIKQKEK